MHVDLSMLWRQASTTPVHGPACACAVPMAFTLTPASFELDVLDFVAEKHRLRDDPTWAAMEREREQSQGSPHDGQASEDFASWLARACQACLDQGTHDQVIADVIVVLESRIAHSAGRFSSPQAKATGWLTALSRSAG